MTVGAIVLVGGRARRMAGAAKPLLEVGGRTLLDRTVSALTDAGCLPIIVAGPVLDDRLPVRWVREDPPFAGPVAGIAAALAAMPEPEPEWTLVLAGDLPHADAIVGRLTARLADAADAVVFTADAHPQWLAGAYRTAALRTAVGPADVTGASCRAVLGGLDIAWLTDEDGITADIDTPADLTRVRAALEEEQ